jgi:hypothetical protein
MYTYLSYFLLFIYYCPYYKAGRVDPTTPTIRTMVLLVLEYMLTAETSENYTRKVSLTQYNF